MSRGTRCTQSPFRYARPKTGRGRPSARRPRCRGGSGFASRPDGAAQGLAELGEHAADPAKARGDVQCISRGQPMVKPRGRCESPNDWESRIRCDLADAPKSKQSSLTPFSFFIRMTTTKRSGEIRIWKGIPRGYLPGYAMESQSNYSPRNQ